MILNKAKDVRTIQLKNELNRDEISLIKACRTAFIARFIVLRESKRTRAHRKIELLEWQAETNVETLSVIIKNVFVENGDNMVSVDRDINRALAHATRSISFFIDEYLSRSTNNFIDALFDYEASNHLLFGAEDQPKPGGWRLPADLHRERSSGKNEK
jgi:hypothetical protein